MYWLGAMAVGIVAVFFAKGSFFADTLFFKMLEKNNWLALIITPSFMAFGVYLTKSFFQGSEGSGIPQTIAAMHIRKKAECFKLLSMKIACGKIFITMLGLCGGASIGREGPTVQIGASIMSFLGRFLHISSYKTRKSLILAGGAAGVAAAFNTPLAGIVFAIEELSRSFETKTSGIVLTTVVIAGIVSMSITGNYTYFGRSNLLIDSHENWVYLVILCGIVCGLIGTIFNYTIIHTDKVLGKKLSAFTKARPVIFAAICGLLIAIIGRLSGNLTFGTGYEQACKLIQGQDIETLWFGFYKFLATILSYISGIPGGIFAPSLSIGAGIGANIADFFPDMTKSVIIIMCMAGYFSSVVHSPITAAVIVMEMTSDQKTTISLLAVSMISYAVSKTFCEQSLYWALADKFLPADEKERLKEVAAPSQEDDDENKQN
ncbi:MAG: chloride channel protein [Alphaproteobacteria bacterium]